MLKKPFPRISVFLLINLSFLLSFPSSSPAAETKTLRFIEGQLNISEGNNHSRLSTDFIGGILTGISTPILNELMDNIRQTSSFQTSSASPSGSLGSPIYVAQYPGSMEPSQIVLVTDGSLPQGTPDSSSH